jgi:hypothetical protein
MTQVGFTLKVRLGGLNRAVTPNGRPVGRDAHRVRGVGFCVHFLRAWPLRILRIKSGKSGADDPGGVVPWPGLTIRTGIKTGEKSC